ncbi:nicotinate (nicotinamide) nucleotide adenylyltransferase [Sorangium cellulosum]|uniref:Probable nicotinate-nucleotide adenylyltransferase n=1 Tax=Sorangium cellulosum TaxID=56 RepID=A0A150QB19_SORCE|nr:nicotinate (nicotinamide) nucleotide adenylyltransferase [Sorangium cellulosum]KYF64926.1 nicotinate-nucleotide adenylyltransferase [Sorangium cellulosum]
MARTAEARAGAPPSRPSEARRVAVFGGSFNPPHVAHVLAATYAISVAPIDEVLVVPVYRHPFSKELASFEHRLAMCQLALGWLPGVSVSTVERELGGESLTLRTLEHLAATHPGWAMRLLVGADVLPDLPRWHRFDRIEQIAPPIVLGRSGFVASVAPHPDDAAAVARPALRAADVLLPQISSSDVRRAFAAGDLEAVRQRVPSAVLDYALAHGLYGSNP